MVQFSITLNDPNQDFKVTLEYLYGTIETHGLLIGTYTRPTQECHLEWLSYSEWLSDTVNDTKHRAASLRQRSFLLAYLVRISQILCKVCVCVSRTSQSLASNEIRPPLSETLHTRSLKCCRHVAYYGPDRKEGAVKIKLCYCLSVRPSRT